MKPMGMNAPGMKRLSQIYVGYIYIIYTIYTLLYRFVHLPDTVSVAFVHEVQPAVMFDTELEEGLKGEPHPLEVPMHE